MNKKRGKPETKSIINDNIIYTDSFGICELFSEFSYYLRDVYENTPFKFSSTQIDEVESTLLSLKVTYSHICT